MQGQILIVEDKPEWLEKLSNPLVTEGYRVYKATNEETAFQRLEHDKLDVVVLDLRLNLRADQGLQGLSVLYKLDVMPNSPAVIICSGHVSNSDVIHEALYGYDIFAIIRKERYNERQFVQTVKDAVELRRGQMEVEPPKPVETGSPCPLTEREKQILRMIARGRTNLHIAFDLNIKLNTIKTHVQHIFLKLDAYSRIDAIRKARKLECLPLDDDLD